MVGKSGFKPTNVSRRTYHVKNECASTTSECSEVIDEHCPLHVLTNAKDLINQLSSINVGNLLFYTFYDSIAFVGQTVFQSFTTNVVVLEEKMVNKGLRRFFSC